MCTGSPQFYNQIKMSVMFKEDDIVWHYRHGKCRIYGGREGSTTEVWVTVVTDDKNLKFILPADELSFEPYDLQTAAGFTQVRPVDPELVDLLEEYWHWAKQITVVYGDSFKNEGRLHAIAFLKQR